MTAERKINTRLEQQVGLWLKKQEALHQDECRLENLPVRMEYGTGRAEKS